MPSDWVVAEAADTLFAAATRADHGGPWVNLTVAHRRVGVGSHAAAFQALGDHLEATLSSVEVRGGTSMTGPDDDRRYVASTAYDGPDGERVARLDVSICAPNPHGFLVDDIFTLTFTTPDGDDEANENTILAVVKSFAFV
ncbi:MAG: hypothetical protein AAF081_07345 [Actinomycetota bacterium]